LIQLAKLCFIINEIVMRGTYGACSKPISQRLALWFNLSGDEGDSKDEGGKELHLVRGGSLRGCLKRVIYGDVLDV
jgi:hypothetical protein